MKKHKQNMTVLFILKFYIGSGLFFPSLAHSCVKNVKNPDSLRIRDFHASPSCETWGYVRICILLLEGFVWRCDLRNGISLHCSTATRQNKDLRARLVLLPELLLNEMKQACVRPPQHRRAKFWLEFIIAFISCTVPFFWCGDLISSRTWTLSHTHTHTHE